MAKKTRLVDTINRDVRLRESSAPVKVIPV